ncbi:CPCC family cysteine-rich protein [Leifsonia sp. NPDC080035]|uniref:CPCC family cysteine-rich protein n=1 Tax=Leifsonia sp. NPDC080035 TaxID=3143936 RepID=A0AAU7GIM7_9MICO
MVGGVNAAYPCPCCGYLQFDSPPGSYEICAICFWEDDAVQLLQPTFSGGANRVSLLDAQRSYAAVGACEPRFVTSVRKPETDDRRDPGFRPLHEHHDVLDVDDAVPLPSDRTLLYWWRPGRRSARA